MFLLITLVFHWALHSFITIVTSENMTDIKPGCRERTKHLSRIKSEAIELQSGCMWVAHPWPSRGCAEAKPYDVIIVKLKKRCFTIFHTLLHLYSSYDLYSYSQAIFVQQMSTAFVALWAPFELGAGGKMPPPPIEKPAHIISKSRS
jgi:hypothetical protein